MPYRDNTNGAILFDVQTNTPLTTANTIITTTNTFTDTLVGTITGVTGVTTNISDAIVTDVTTDISNMIINKINNVEEKSFEFYISSAKKWNVKPNGLNEWTICNTPSIVNINIIVPEKVVEVTIYDGKQYTFKQVCKEPDTFDFKFALALAWAKYQNEKGSFGSKLNIAGIERAAKRFIKYSLDYNKEFDRAIKAYNNWVKEQEKEKAEEEERKAIIERRRAKNKKRREKMAAKKSEFEANIIAKAIAKAQKGNDDGK